MENIQNLKTCAIVVAAGKGSRMNTEANKQFMDLVDNDTALGVEADTYTADKGYDDGDLHAELVKRGKHSALMLTRQRTGKKDEGKQMWLEMLLDPFYQAGVRVRYRIERTFGEAKLWHRLGLARYRGVANYRIQAYLTFMAINLKRILWRFERARLRPV